MTFTYIYENWVELYLIGSSIVLLFLGGVFYSEWSDNDNLLDTGIVLIACMLGWPFLPIIALAGSVSSMCNKKYKDGLLFLGISFLCLGVLLLLPYVHFELNLTPEDQLARERAQLAEEKREIEEAHARAIASAQERVREETDRRYAEAMAQKAQRAQAIKDARTQIEIAKVQAERAKLRNQPIPKEVAEQITQANRQLERLQNTSSVTASGSTELVKAQEELARLKREGVDYSKLSEPQMTSAPPAQPRAPTTPIDEQTKLILSGLWLGACFFLQRVFEKLFKDKGYALLTVCAAGFLLAFFTANYFLVGGSVTGGLIGSVGDRG